MVSKNRVLILAIACGWLVAGSWSSALASPPGAPRPQSERLAATGAVTGRVLFKGPHAKPRRILMSEDPVCVSLEKGPVYAQDGQVNPNGTLPNAFVYVKSGLGNRHFTPPRTPVVLDQSGCMYVPHVLGVMVGQPLKIVSEDPTTHNIHILPKLNRAWNQSQPPGAPPLIKRFTRPEVMIPVQCNQHPWMRAYIGVTSNPFYAVTGSAGSFSLHGLPPGHYTIEVWTATFGVQQQEVTVSSGQTSPLNFTFRQE
jgi:hypothetical protein